MENKVDDGPDSRLQGLLAASQHVKNERPHMDSDDCHQEAGLGIGILQALYSIKCRDILQGSQLVSAYQISRTRQLGVGRGQKTMISTEYAVTSKSIVNNNTCCVSVQATCHGICTDRPLSWAAQRCKAASCKCATVGETDQQRGYR